MNYKHKEFAYSEKEYKEMRRRVKEFEKGGDYYDEKRMCGLQENI